MYIFLVTRDIAYKIKNQKHEIFHYTTPWNIAKMDLMGHSPHLCPMPRYYA